MNDQEDIIALLKAFAAAMYAWGTKHAPIIDKAFDEEGGDAAARMAEAQGELRTVFMKYCVDTTNPERRGSAGDPPDYHPDYFEILEVKVKGKKATARVRQPALGRKVPSKGGGIVAMVPQIFTYYLRMTENGWRLEDRRDCFFENSGKTIKTAL